MNGGLVWAAVATVTLGALIGCSVLLMIRRWVRSSVGRAFVDLWIFVVLLLSWRDVRPVSNGFVRAIKGYDAELWIRPAPWMTLVPAAATVAMLIWYGIRSRREHQVNGRVDS